ncbi:MAG: hypothetical protein WD904_13515 [Dehalococcoidia bacterium]
MSTLSDKIRKASRTTPAPLGFAAVALKTRPVSMLCAIRLSDTGKIADAAKDGADVVILEGVPAAKLKGLDKANGATIGVAGDFGAEAWTALRNAGVDFGVLPGPSAAATNLLEEGIGRVLTIDPSLDDVSLRLAGDLGLDAVIIHAPELPLTIERLLTVRRVSALARMAILADISADADAGSLELLRDSGVACVIIGSNEVGKLGALKDRIVGLPERGRRREDRNEAILPAAGSGHDDDDDYDD